MTDKDEIKTEQETADTSCCEENTDKEAELKDTEETAAEQDAAEEAETDNTKEDAEEETADTAKPDKNDKQIEELNDKYKRLFAEFDNFRKRTDAEKAGMFTEGERTVLLKVLPLIDNFERAMASIPEDQKETALAEGIDKTYKSFMSQLAELGVTPIDAAGKPFNANLHNAVMHIEDEETDENTVVEEFQKGYMFKDKVLRYSMVKVAN